MIDVIMPQMGESIVEGTLTKWLKKAGDRVERDEPLFEISTDKVDTEIPSPSAGTLSEIIVEEGKTVGINTVVGRISDGANGAAPAQAAAAPPPEPAAGPSRRQPHHRLRRKQRRRLLRRNSNSTVNQPRPSQPLSKKPRDRFRRWSARWRAKTIST